MNFSHFLLILLILPVTFAASFDSYNILYDAERSHITIDSTLFLESQTSGLDFSIFKRPENLQVTSSVPIEYNLIENNGYNIAIDFIQPTSGNISIKIQFNTKLVEPLNDRDIFSLAFEAPLDIESFSLKLVLPSTSQIYYQNNQQIVSPRANVETDGKRIIINWNSSLNQGDSFVALASFTKQQSQIQWIPIIVLIIVLFAGSTFYAWNFFKKKSHKPIISSMSEDERELFYLIQHGRGVTQEELREKTGHSKSKISKVIRNLEKMDVVKKTPYKKTNKLESKL